MLKATETQPQKIDFSAMSRAELEAFAMEKASTVVSLEARLKHYEEQLRKNRHTMYGPSSERHPGQISFFNEAEQETLPAQPEPAEEEVIVKPKAKKQKGHKQAVIRELPREVVEYTLSEEDRVCPKCGSGLEEMKTVSRVEIEFKPATYTTKEYVTHIFTCRNCDKNGTEGTLISAPSPTGMFRNSLASPSFVANVIKNKYVLSLPLYRQEQEMLRSRLDIKRNTLANWVINASKIYLTPVYEHMKQLLVSGDVIHADETPVEVLHEPGRAPSAQSYMWMYRTGGREGRQIVLFDYSPGRAAEYPKAFLSGYSGYIHCDGYSSYRVLVKENDTGPPGVVIVGCWAHARRKFDDIIKALAKGVSIKGTATETALAYIRALFKIEDKIKEYSDKDRLAYRQEHALPVVDKYFAWLKSIVGNCSGAIEKAVCYSLNIEKDLRVYLTDGRLEISNNLGENAIRPFCVGRKNWLFCDTPNGADASAVCYSVIRTAEAYGVDAFEYLKYIFETLKDTDINTFNMETLMPWSPAFPLKCTVPQIPGKRAS
jgi:transposase